ncbi:MAG: Cupin domain protein [Candidatus Omnitrophica bacterium ADurb.Bin277]|nr:MAG: Cupin domain protein [Candidatus Omnitrophica bacterium ADurb.Bin277]
MIHRKDVRVSETREHMRGGSGKVTVRHYFKPEEIKARTRLCAELRIPAGAGIGNHDHMDEDEIYIIRQGTGIMTENDKEFTVSAGDAIVTGQGASHSIRNPGPDDLVITAVIIKY